MPGTTTRIDQRDAGNAVACSVLLLVLFFCPFWLAQPARGEIAWSGDVYSANPTTWCSSTDGFIGKTGNGTLDITDGGLVSSLTEGDLTGYTLLTVTAVPEPSTLAGLLGFCLIGFVASARRKRHAEWGEMGTLEIYVTFQLAYRLHQTHDYQIKAQPHAISDRQCSGNI